MPHRAFQIVYTSVLTADAASHDDVLREIARTSQRNNAHVGVTGALLVAGNRVVQLLEGDEAAVREVLARIEADGRHTDIQRLTEVPEGKPSFAQWSMGVRRVAAESPTAEALDALLRAYQSAFRFDLQDFAKIVRDAYEMDEPRFG